MLTKSALKKHVFYRFFSSSFFIYVSTVCLETCAGTCMHHRFRPPSLSGNIRKFKLRGYPAKYGTWRPKMAQVFLFCFFSKFFLCRDNRVGKLALAQRLTLSVPRTSAASCWPHVGSVSLLSPCSRWDFD